MNIHFRSKAGVSAHIHGCNVFGSDEQNTQLPLGGFAMSGEFDEMNGELPAMLIRWQSGPVDRKNGYPYSGAKPNGTFVEDVLEVCRLRLAFYQQSCFPCEENAEAEELVKKAIAVLERRRRDRRARCVEGKNEK